MYGESYFDVSEEYLLNSVKVSGKDGGGDRLSIFGLNRDYVEFWSVSGNFTNSF